MSVLKVWKIGDHTICVCKKGIFGWFLTVSGYHSINHVWSWKIPCATVSHKQWVEVRWILFHPGNCDLNGCLDFCYIWNIFLLPAQKTPTEEKKRLWTSALSWRGCLISFVTGWILAATHSVSLCRRQLSSSPSISYTGWWGCLFAFILLSNSSPMKRKWRQLPHMLQSAFTVTGLKENHRSLIWTKSPTVWVSQQIRPLTSHPTPNHPPHTPDPPPPPHWPLPPTPLLIPISSLLRHLSTAKSVNRLSSRSDRFSGNVECEKCWFARS